LGLCRAKHEKYEKQQLTTTKKFTILNARLHGTQARSRTKILRQLRFLLSKDQVKRETKMSNLSAA